MSKHVCYSKRTTMEIRVLINSFLCYPCFNVHVSGIIVVKDPFLKLYMYVVIF